MKRKTPIFYLPTRIEIVQEPSSTPSSDLCVSTEAFSKSVATLGNVEENDSVSRALAKLAEVEEKIEGLHEEQVG